MCLLFFGLIVFKYFQPKIPIYAKISRITRVASCSAENGTVSHKVVQVSVLIKLFLMFRDQDEFITGMSFAHYKPM